MGEREGGSQRPDASYHDAQGATPRASLEGESRSWRGRRGGGRGGGAKDAHSFLESRGPLLITEVFPFAPREIRTSYTRLLIPPFRRGGETLVRYWTP